MSEPARAPQTREEMIRAVCEANGGYRNSGECICIHEGVPPCLDQAALADDVLAWIADARAEAFRQAASCCENLAGKASGHGFKDDAAVWNSASFAIQALMGAIAKAEPQHTSDKPNCAVLPIVAEREANCQEPWHLEDGVPYCDTCGLYRNTIQRQYERTRTAREGRR